MTTRHWAFVSVLAAVLTALIALDVVWRYGQVPSSAAPERGRGS